MNLKILSLVIIGVCILLPDVCYAFLSKDVHLLNMQNGLADNTVSAVYKDKEGFVWFGTRNGLSRYDGRRITNFERSRSYPSISNLKEVFDGHISRDVWRIFQEIFQSFYRCEMEYAHWLYPAFEYLVFDVHAKNSCPFERKAMRTFDILA